jgi:hypothetical protein
VRLEAADAAESAANGPAAGSSELAREPVKVPLQPDTVPKRAAPRSRKPAAPARHAVCGHSRAVCMVVRRCAVNFGQQRPCETCTVLKA